MENRIYLINTCKTIMFLLLLVFILPTIYAATPTWEDESQLYRQEINITGASSPINTLTHSFIINSSNTGVNFNFSTHRESLRFYYYNETSNNATLLNHYAKSWDTTANNASILLKTPYLDSTQDANIWMYYGDTSKSNIEDYCSVFIYCDLFEDGTIDSRLSITDQDLVSGTDFKETGGELSITAGGDDTWENDDEYGSVYLEDIKGDVETRLTITSQTDPNVWAKSGIMIKNDMTAATVSTGYTFTVVTPGNGYSFQRDSNSNGYLEDSTTTDSSVYPSHVRHIKQGNQHRGYYSKTTQNSWNLLNTQDISSTNPTQDLGISLTSHAGSTLGTSTFDNFTVRRYTSDTITQSFGEEQKINNELKANVINPFTTTINNIVQNKTIDFTINLTCSGIDSSSNCGDVSGTLLYNNSGTFQSVSQSPTTPLWTLNSTTQNCTIAFNSSCLYNWEINVTGPVNSTQQILSEFSSNNTDIDSQNSSIVSVRVVNGNSITFNQSYYKYSNFTKDSGPKNKQISLIADNGNNTNINLNCEQGNCSTITQDWTNGDDLNEDEKQNITFTCDDSSAGNYSATYSATSNEFDGSTKIQLECTVEPIFGPISATLNSPGPGINTLVSQNKTFKLNTSLNCTGFCGEISGYAIIERNNWWNKTWKYRKTLNYSINDATPNNYQIFVELNSTDLGPNFNWTNSCSDIRVVKDNTPLDIWIEQCNSSSQNLDFWVETQNSLTSGSSYSFDLYYGNSDVVSISNASNTFIQDRIHLVTGRCPSGNSACGDYMDNVADGETIRANIGNTNWGIDGSAYINEINYGDNPYGNNNNFYMRFRTLYIPSTSGSNTFGISSDDGSNVGLWSGDGYGTGLSTPSSLTSSQDIVSSWYGAHAGGTCGSSSAVEGTRTLNKDEGYWIDFTMQETDGGQEAELCIDRGVGFNTVGTSSFSGEIFAREYVDNPPSFNSISSEDTIIISTNTGDTPFYSLSSQPQTCIPQEDGICSFEWVLNATGPINTSYNISAEFSSSKNSINDDSTQATQITITNFISNVSLITPTNNSKIISNKPIQFSWDIENPNSPVNASIYLNGMKNKTLSCTTSATCSSNISLQSGRYSWFVEINDSGTLFTSKTNSFWKISNYSSSISKKITNSGTNLYNIGISLTNNLDTTLSLTPLDFVSTNFTAGSFNPSFDFQETVSIGRIYGWNLTLASNSNLNLNYSITKNSNRNSLENNFIVGLD